MLEPFATMSDEAAWLMSCRELVVGHAGHGLLPPLNLELCPGQLWAVIGKNGSGKTTLLRTLLGMLRPVAGEVVRRPGVPVSYLPQRTTVDDLYPLRARDVVMMGCARGARGILAGRGWGAAADAALAEVQLEGVGPKPFRKLSERQTQRVLFARLLASEAQIAFLDEPTSAMDQRAQREGLGLLRRLCERRGLCLVVVSHYLGLAEELADRVLWVDRDGPRAESGSPAEVLGAMRASGEAGWM